MAATYVPMIGFLTLIAWRLVLSILHHRHLDRAVARPGEPRNNYLGHGLPFLRRANPPPNGGAPAGNGWDDIGPASRKDRAEAYLRRAAALTGATQSGHVYILDVGKTRFEVRYRFVARIKDLAEPPSSHQETCFYPMHKEMPRAEEIATALLQLANNPALFDKWAAQSGQAFKADGQVFARTQ